MALLVSSIKHLKMKSYQSYMLFQKEGTLPKCFYEAAIAQISKPKKDFMEKNHRPVSPQEHTSENP